MIVLRTLDLALWMLDIGSIVLDGGARPLSSGEDWYSRDLP